MTGTLGGDHDHASSARRLDETEVNGEPMSKEKGLALGQVGLDLVFVDLGLLHVGHPDHDDVGLASGLGHVDDLEAVLLGDLDGLAALIEADDDLAAAFLKV